MIGFFILWTPENKVPICASCGNTLRRANTLEKNHRVEPRKVDKSNGIEIQISGALNDAYRISRPWKGRKCGGKDSVMSCRKEYRKEREGDDRWCSQNLTQSILRRVVKHFEIFLQTLTRCWCNFICDILSDWDRQKSLVGWIIMKDVNVIFTLNNSWYYTKFDKNRFWVKIAAILPEF